MRICPVFAVCISFMDDFSENMANFKENDCLMVETIQDKTALIAGAGNVKSNPFQNECA